MCCRYTIVTYSYILELYDVLVTDVTVQIWKIIRIIWTRSDLYWILEDQWRSLISGRCPWNSKSWLMAKVAHFSSERSHYPNGNLVKFAIILIWNITHYFSPLVPKCLLVSSLPICFSLFTFIGMHGSYEAWSSSVGFIIHLFANYYLLVQYIPPVCLMIWYTCTDLFFSAEY